jgi:prepilin-type N-terminal cleavage/methylation domain-containing protein
MKKTSLASAAFTLIELLVVMAIIAVLATLVLTQGPALLARAQMTGTMSNARQLHMAAMRMATDGSTNSNSSLVWPGDDTTLNTLESYGNRLVQNDYLSAGDLQKLLSAPGANAIVASTTQNGTTTVTLTGKSALKIYKIREVDPTNAIFAATANFTYNTALNQTKAPYGEKGFVVIRKGGDASLFQRAQATAPGGAMDKYRNTVGALPLPATGGDEAPPAEDATMVLTNPQ